MLSLPVFTIPVPNPSSPRLIIFRKTSVFLQSKENAALTASATTHGGSIPILIKCSITLKPIIGSSATPSSLATNTGTTSSNCVELPEGNPKFNSTHPENGIGVLFTARPSSMPVPMSSVRFLIVTWGTFCCLHFSFMRQTCDPVSHNALVSTPSSRHVIKYFFPMRLRSPCLCFGDRRLTWRTSVFCDAASAIFASRC